jgi:hypothetical protein
MCRIGGFDTHASQVEKFDTTMGLHAALIYHLFAAVKAFYDDLKGLGLQDKVLSMTFTEFGRRVYSNASYGSDHGTAFPMFLFGKGLKPGVVGPTPNLSDLNGGNLKFSIDYRQVYTSVVQDWFGASDAALNATLFNSWLDKKVSLFEWTGIPEIDYTGKPKLLDCFPNPASDVVQFTFFLHRSSNVKIKLYDVNGKKITDILDDYRFFGKSSVSFNVSFLAAGVYVYSFETENITETKKLIVEK